MKSKKIQKPVGYKLESAVKNYLIRTGAFKGCGVIEQSSANEAPESLPCMVVGCDSVSRTSETEASMMSRDAEISVTIYADSEETSKATLEDLAIQLEYRLDHLAGMQAEINKPTAKRDTRKVKGLHLHYIGDTKIDLETEGTDWRFTASCTALVQIVG